MKHSALLSILALQLGAAACHLIPSFDESTPKESNGTSTTIDGPVDGLRSLRFVYHQILPPQVQPVDADTRLAVDGKSIRGSAGDRKSPKAIHTQLGPNEFAIHLADAEKFAVVQEADNWCWAACVLMVNRYRGERLRSGGKGPDAGQGELARHFLGSLEDQPADLAVMMRGLNPQLEAKLHDEIVTLGAPIETQSTDRLLLDMCAGSPGIVGLDMGDYRHACVVIGARYSCIEGQQPLGQLKSLLRENEAILAGAGFVGARHVNDVASLLNSVAIHEVTLIDPSDGRVRVLTGTELKKHCLFLMTPELGKDILLQEHNVSGSWDDLTEGVNVPSGAAKKSEEKRPPTGNAAQKVLQSVFGG